MENRTWQILKTLIICLTLTSLVAFLKILYGTKTQTLSFVADGFHMLFDSGGTLLAMISIFFASRPPDDGHPYGHFKLEIVAALILGVLLLFGAYEVGHVAIDKLMNPNQIPRFSYFGIVVVLFSMVVNYGVARYEANCAKKYNSQFLEADATHNQADFYINFLVLFSLISSQFALPYVDGIASLLITLYLTYLAILIFWRNVNPLIDSSILNPEEVTQVVQSVPGVIDCHNIRSRGAQGHHFLDLNIHLEGSITLEKAHEITHEVEELLKKNFPGLQDIVIHTEPHNHPPCRKD